MPLIKVVVSQNPLIIRLLSRELENEIPDLDIRGSEKRLLDFAYRDLEVSLIHKLNSPNVDEIEETLMNKKGQEELKSFLKIWTKKY